jgi:predicted NAD/FAD-binding protein
MKKKIAIIGGGIAGLTAGYLLHKRCDVTLFEKTERIGGNAYTLTGPGGEDLDIAACAFGRFSYRNLFRLFSKLHIETVGPIGINPFGTFGLGIGFRNMETKKGFYMTPGIRGLTAQRFEILSPAHINGIRRLAAGLKRASRLLDAGGLEGLSIAETVEKIPEFTGEAKLIFIGGLCLISSMHCEDVLDASASFFIEKLRVHGDLLPPKALFSVRFPKDRTKSYVEALAEGFKDRIVLNAGIRTVIRQDNTVTVMMKNEEKFLFDKVVFACNADQALSLLEKPTTEEERLLGAWKYTEGKIVVHSDHSHFPKRALMEGYTFLYRNAGRYIETSISGSLWALPGAPKDGNLISTQHPNFSIDKNLVVFEKIFRTPLFDSKSCSTIKELPSLNGLNNSYYCGSHFGFGVHEDAVTSAMAAAGMMGVHI